MDIFWKLLIDVLDNPRVAPYIKEFRMQGWFFEWGYDLDQHIPYTDEQFVVFKKALSKHLLPEKLEEWIKELEAEHESPAISLLLILLPNINSIKIEHCNNLAHQLREVIERIWTDCAPRFGILSHLERVSLQYNDYFDEVVP